MFLYYYAVYSGKWFIMIILGIHAAFSATSHDPSACLIIDGKVVAAIEEERINRIKVSSGFFPAKAVYECLKLAELRIEDVDIVASDGISSPTIKDKIRRSLVDLFGFSPEVELVDHPYSHCAGAFMSSGLDEALVVSVDGSGDKTSTLVCLAQRVGTSIKFKELYREGMSVSLGAYYTAFTNYLGFRTVEGEYKVMGMAAYGQDKFDLSEMIDFDRISETIASRSKGAVFEQKNYSSLIEPSYNEEYIYRLTKVRRPVFSDGEFTQEHFDLAASVQAQFTRAYIGLIRHWLAKTKQRKLCLAGGCVLNCLANKEILGDGLDDIYVMPAASDRGLSMGSAMYAANINGENVLSVNNMYLGKSFDASQIKKTLQICGVAHKELSDPTADCANSIADGLVVGWFQGRSEFGPRALGHRSILASPRVANMKDILNAKIKFRESYRPFAPAILKADLERYYSSKIQFPYMTFTVDIPSKLAAKMPEAVHFDGTARVQSVSEKDSDSFYGLLNEVRKISGIGAVINTSFNLSGEPIVDSPYDAIRTFYSSGIDALYLGNFKLTKNADLSAKRNISEV